MLILRKKSGHKWVCPINCRCPGHGLKEDVRIPTVSTVDKYFMQIWPVNSKGICWGSFIKVFFIIIIIKKTVEKVCFPLDGVISE